MDKPIRCAIIGQHPMRFPWGFDEEDESCGKMKMELAQQIMVLRQNGVSQFLVACDCGVGLYAAEIVNGLRATTDHDPVSYTHLIAETRLKLRRVSTAFAGAGANSAAANDASIV